MAITVAYGGFLRVDWSGRPTVLSGEDLAEELCDISLYGGNLRLWLSWPTSPHDQDKLDNNIHRLADTTGATVWTAQMDATVDVLDGCRDLATHNEAGEPEPWRVYRPAGVTEPPPFISDVDGRLVPAGEITTVSGIRDSRHSGLFLVELSTLDDGRLGVWYPDNTLLAVGPRIWREQLEVAGWTDQEVVLLSAASSQQLPNLREHVAALTTETQVAIWAPEPGGRTAITDGRVRAVRPDGTAGTWHQLVPGGPRTNRHSSAGWLLPAAQPSHDHQATAPAQQEKPAEQAEPTQPVEPPADHKERGFVASPRPGRGHGLGWLPDQPPTNPEDITLYVASPWPTDRVTREGVPSADLYLIGVRDPGQCDPRQHVLPIRVAPGGAVPIAKLAVALRANVRRFAHSADTFLLPAGWLHHARLCEGSSPLVLRSTGSEHGVDGLPDDVVRWPPARGVAKAYVLIPHGGRTRTDLLRLHLRRPPPTPAHHLAQVRLRAGDAIDVAASDELLRPLHSVRSRLGDLRWAGADLVLPRRCFDQVVATKLFDADGLRWRRLAVPGRAPLTTLLADSPVADHP